MHTYNIFMIVHVRRNGSIFSWASGSTSFDRFWKHDVQYGQSGGFPMLRLKQPSILGADEVESSYSLNCAVVLGKNDSTHSNSGTNCNQTFSQVSWETVCLEKTYDEIFFTAWPAAQQRNGPSHKANPALEHGPFLARPCILCINLYCIGWWNPQKGYKENYSDCAFSSSHPRYLDMCGYEQLWHPSGHTQDIKG